MALVCDRCDKRNGPNGNGPQVESILIQVNNDTPGKFGMKTSWDLCPICRDGVIQTIRDYCRPQGYKVDV